ncbi:MAG: UV DNA damage repair endonuclease UvsE [Solirubrobacterales bacterium]
MQVRFGYVAMSVNLEKSSPSGTVTVKAYSALAAKDSGYAMNRVRRTARANLENTLRLLKYNRMNDIRMYRFSSKLIPLATHPLLADWDYAADLAEPLEQIGYYVKENEMRVSFHPDHYNLLNSPRGEVLEAALIDLDHHQRMLDAMGLSSQAKLVMHLGGAYRDKKAAIERFEMNWNRLPQEIQNRLVLENDDKVYHAQDVLALCERLKVPMVLDLHHHACNPSPDSLDEYLPRVFATWAGDLPPKIHVSSPRSPEDPRSHADYVSADDLIGFLKTAASHTEQLDVMVEAKQKDLAMLRLVEELSGFPGINPVDRGQIEVLPM